MRFSINKLGALSIFLLSAICSSAFALENIDVNKTPFINNLGGYLKYYIDESGQMNASEILDLPSSKWLDIKKDVPNFGFSDSDYWFAIELTNEAPSSSEHYFSASYPLLDYIDYYLFENRKQIESVSVGDNILFSERPIQHRFFLFPVKLRPHQSVTVLFHMQTLGSAQFPLELVPAKKFLEKDQFELALQILFIGIMIAIAGYNLILYLFIRETAYLYYVGYVAAYSLMQFTMRGLGNQWLWPFATGINESSLLYSLAAAIVFACLFSISFLQLRQNQIFFFHIIRALFCLTIATICVSFFVSYSISIQIVVILVIISSIVMLGAGITQWSYGNKAAKIYTIAWGAFWVGAFMVASNRFGLITRSFITENATQIGATIEAFLLSLALAERINSDKRKHFELQAVALAHEKSAREANEKALEVQRQANEELEHRVQSRTRDLEKALNDLSVANIELNNLRTIDSLTQVKNRTYFDEIIHEEWSRAARAETTLSLIIIDVDHFKMINDKHGHLAGDEALKQIAQLISLVLKRPSDTISRYGGEEFAIILPHTTYEGALQLGEKIRAVCEQSVFPAHNTQIKATISVGVSSITNPRGKDVNIASLIDAADQALYKSKHEGRNRVNGIRIDMTE